MRGFLKVTYSAALLLFSVLMVSGCRTEKMINYVHKPSEEFYRDMDFDAEEVEGFKNAEVLFVIDIKESRHGQYIVWLGLYSREEQALVIDEVRAFGGGWENTIKINEEVRVGSTVKGSELIKASIRLFDIGGGAKALGDIRDFTMELRYSVSGVKRNMIFHIERKEEKQTVFRT